MPHTTTMIPMLALTILVFPQPAVKMRLITAMTLTHARMIHVFPQPAVNMPHITAMMRTLVRTIPVFRK